MATIHLIRHGQASSGEEDYDQLSELGYRQAEHLGKELAKRIEKFDALVSGSLRRHRQTAEQCLLSYPTVSLDSVSELSGWNEYDHQDILRQLRPEFATVESTHRYIRAQADPMAAYEDSFNQAIKRWMDGDHDADYGETWSSFKARVHSAFEDAVAVARAGKDVAVFTSGGPISLVSQALLGVDETQLMRLNWTLVNCGVTKLVVTPKRVFIGSLNEHTHFEGADRNHYISYA